MEKSKGIPVLTYPEFRVVKTITENCRGSPQMIIGMRVYLMLVFTVDDVQLIFDRGPKSRETW